MQDAKPTARSTATREMKAIIDPPMSQWHPRERSGPPTISTGHQAGFWHPGIFAKCLATARYAKQIDGKATYLLVDHDDNDSCRLELPIIQDEQLQVLSLTLAPSLTGVALRSQPLIDWEKAACMLRDAMASTEYQLAADVQPLLSAIESQVAASNTTEKSQTRAHQWARLLQQMWRPIIGELDIIHSTSLIDAAMVHRLLHDAPACARSYNEAVAAFPQAGMSPMIIERDRVELPLWDIGDASAPQPRWRVFADLSDSKPWLVRSDGQPIQQQGDHYLNLAPRALLLTALMRSAHCDLFIHGQGGGNYDRVMEQWWTQWTSQPLAPMAVVSADVYLPFKNVPIAEPADLTRAIWFEHHLPHNLDRYLPASQLDEAMIQRKGELLAHMEDDRDPRRRAKLFRELHQINTHFARQHEPMLALAAEQTSRVRKAIANRAVARKRDWCFLLYDASRWNDLM